MTANNSNSENQEIVKDAPEIEPQVLPTKQEIVKKKIVKEKIVKVPDGPKPKRGRPAKPPKPVLTKNVETGEYFNPDGTLNKRATQGAKNIQNSSVYKALQQAKLIREEQKQKKDSELESYYESSSDEEDEFDIIEPPIIVHPAKEPLIVKEIVEVEKVVEKEVIREVIPPAVESRIASLMTENKKIKDGMLLNNFYNQIGIRSREIQIKR